VSRLAARRTWTVSVLASKLADECRRLDELQVGDQAVKATFELGYGQLDAEQARGFRLLGLADGPDISLHAAAAMLQRSAEATEDLLESLVDASLLESAAPGRYRFHDLVRLFARACAERDEQPPSERDAALFRLLDFYLATARGVYALERPGERLIDHLENTGTPGLSFTDRAGAVDWLFAESACFLAAALQLGYGSTLRRAVDLLMATNDLGEAGINVRQYVLTAERLKEAAQAAEDPYAEARARSVLTGLHLTTGSFDEADEEARLAGVLGATAEDPISSSYALNDRGIVANYQGRHGDAEGYLSQALSTFQGYGNHPSEASALCNIARARIGTGDPSTAVTLTEQAVVIYRRFDASVRLANGLYALGIALTAAGRLDEAERRLLEALEIFRHSRQRLWEGMTHFRLAEVYIATDQVASAAGQAERALVLTSIGGEWRRGTVLLVLGKSLEALRQPDRARACWREALSIFDELGAVEGDEVRGLLTPSVAA
ncbi:MAG: tetratricopeptide repeat protein, partial [Streptomyces sp.]